MAITNLYSFLVNQYPGKKWDAAQKPGFRARMHAKPGHGSKNLVFIQNRVLPPRPKPVEIP